MKRERDFQLALVTGATSGIGEAFCHLLASKGINLCITGRNRKRLEELQESLSHHVQVVAIAADLLNKEERQSVLDYIRKEAPDLVVNNAGFGLYGMAIESPVNEEIEILQVNAEVPLEITLEAARSLVSAGRRGVILNVASSASFFAFPYLCVYSAAKTCAVHFSRGLDYELAPKGIRVLAACPGMVSTDFARRAARGKPQGTHRNFMTAEYAAGQLWWQIQKGKKVHIFNWKYRLGVILSKLFPEAITARILQASIAKRIQK